VDDALLGAEPAQLAVAGQAARKGRGVGQRILEVEPDDERRERVDGRDLDLGATAGGEGEAVALEPVRGVGTQDRVRGGVVRVDVDRVGAVELG